MIENSLWTERFRPQTLDDYVGNEHLKEKMQSYIDNNDVSHLLLYGVQGTGKTTLAKILTKSIECDELYINASDENNVDTVRDKIKGFASTMGFKRWKVVILDESDFLTTNAQAILRSLMETFSNSCRFILTCNYVQKIILPIRSRCQEFEIYPPSKPDIAKRLFGILKAEQISFNPEHLKYFINTAYPDIRKMINMIQSSVKNKELQIQATDKIVLSYMDDILDELINTKDPKKLFTNIRQIIINSKVKDFIPLYRFLYDNLSKFATGHIAEVILIIAETQYWDSFAIDKEIHVSAMFVKLVEKIRT